MTDKLARLLLRITADPDADAEEVENLTRRLRQELLQHDVDAVDHVGAAIAPAGAKGDPVTLGTLLVTLAASGRCSHHCHQRSPIVADKTGTPLCYG
jgi:hypothetical protein